MTSPLLKAARRKHIVQPQYLFMDTNCFLNMLPLVEKLATDPRFTVMVPLVVVNELTGLAKGDNSTSLPSLVNRAGQASTYYDAATASPSGEQPYAAGMGGRAGKGALRGANTAQSAAAAMIFLETEFGSASPALRAVTGMGTMMRGIDFCTEDAHRGKETTADDVILQACAKFQASKVKGAAHTASSGQPLPSVFTVALLTGDRNLRLKAHALPIPAMDLGEFYQRAKVKHAAR
jgi:protein SMG6